MAAPSRFMSSWHSSSFGVSLPAFLPFSSSSLSLSSGVFSGVSEAFSFFFALFLRGF